LFVGACSIGWVSESNIVLDGKFLLNLLFEWVIVTGFVVSLTQCNTADNIEITMFLDGNSNFLHVLVKKILSTATFVFVLCIKTIIDEHHAHNIGSCVSVQVNVETKVLKNIAVLSLDTLLKGHVFN